MKNGPTVIPIEQLNHISAGHSLGLWIFLLEIPHIIVGFRELTNYIGERWVNGCENVEETDYFTRFFCGYYM